MYTEYEKNGKNLRVYLTFNEIFHKNKLFYIYFIQKSFIFFKINIKLKFSCKIIKIVCEFISIEDHFVTP